jgi:hypothetical protein
MVWGGICGEIRRVFRRRFRVVFDAVLAAKSSY